MTESQDALVQKQSGLSGNALKVIPIIAMTIDHIAWIGIEEYSQAETLRQIILHSFGRLTAPIMLFFVAEGYHYTHSFRKYLGRMAPLAILMVGRSRGNFHKQMLWLMAFASMYAVAFFIFNNPTYGMVHMACWFTVPLLSLYNGQRGKLRWLGKFFYWYYPAHMALIGLFAHLFPG